MGMFWCCGERKTIFSRKPTRIQVKAGLTGCNVKYVDVDGASHNGFWDSMVMAETYADHILDFI